MACRFPVAVVLSLALVVGACGQGSESGEAGTADQAGEAQDLTPEGPGLAARLFGGGKPAALDVQATHPNGLILQVNSIQAKSTETVLGVTIVNGRDRSTTLNWNPSGKRTYLIASTGEKLYLSPPVGNANLSIPAGQRMEGELVFLGRLPTSGNAVLTINEGASADNQYSNNPYLQAQLPLSSAAFSDDGSKKN